MASWGCKLGAMGVWRVRDKKLGALRSAEEEVQGMRCEAVLGLSRAARGSRVGMGATRSFGIEAQDGDERHLVLLD